MLKNYEKYNYNIFEPKRNYINKNSCFGFGTLFNKIKVSVPVPVLNILKVPVPQANVLGSVLVLV